MLRLLGVLSLLLYFAPSTISQNYIRLTDASGINTDSYQADLVDSATALINVLPPEYRDSFKVFDFGFYVHTENFEGGLPRTWQLAIERFEQSSPYYLAFGKQSDARGVYTRFWVDIRLPEDAAHPCLNASFATTQQQIIEAELETFYTSLGRDPAIYSDVEFYGMSSLQQAIDHAVNCCQNQGLAKTVDNTCSANCPKTPEQVANILTSPIRSIESRYIELTNVTLLKDQIQNVSYSHIEAEQSLVVSIPEYGEYALTEELNALAIELENAEGSANIIVSYYNEDNCAELSEFLGNLPSNSSDDYAEHIVVLDYGEGEPRIFSNIRLGGDAGQKIKNREKSVVFVPVAAIIVREVIKRAIMAGTNVAVNVIVEVAIQKYFGHGNDCSWLDAWKETKISAWSIIIWSVEGVIGDIGGDLAMSVLAGTTEAMLYLFNTPRSEFDVDQLFTKFALGFSISLAQRLVIGRFIHRAYDKFTLKYLADKYDVDGNLIKIERSEFWLLFKNFFLNPRIIKAWELASSKNLPKVLRQDIDVLETIGKYQNSSYSSRLGQLSSQDFADHFEFLAGSIEARQRFTQFLDDELIFLPRSDLEKTEILKILDRDRLKIFDPISPGLSRLDLFKRLVNDAPNPSNPDEALDLINRMLDDVEDAYSGVPKNPNAINMPNIVDGRMYGILDNKYVKFFPDGSRRAFTRKNTIMINSDGSFSIYTRNKNNPPNQIGNLFLSKGM